MRIAATETGSKWILSASLGPNIEGSVAAQRAKEWRSLNEAGRRSASRMVKISQKMWNLGIPEP